MMLVPAASLYAGENVNQTDMYTEDAESDETDDGGEESTLDEEGDASLGDDDLSDGADEASGAHGAPGTVDDIFAIGENLMPLADFPHFFHSAGQPDPFGSGSSTVQFYVPDGPNSIMFSFCLEKGKNAPPQNSPTQYSPMAAPAWSTALGTYATSVLQSHGIDITEGYHRYWAIQNAVWILSGYSVGTAANAPVIQALVAAAGQSVTASTPVFTGISDGGMLRASIYDEDTVRYGPFSISGMSGTATARIYTSNGNHARAWLGNSSGARINLNSVPNATNLYVYLPRYLYETRRINIELSADYVVPNTMDAFKSPYPSDQDQLVMPYWEPRFGIRTIAAQLGGFGECEIVKLDAGWQEDYKEARYSDESEGDAYRLDGAEFAIRQWDGSSFVSTNIPVTYDPETRTYRTGFLRETASNNGLFRIIETTVPYGYRDPVVIEFNIRARYELSLDGVGRRDVNNTLLNARIELQKRDRAEIASGFSDLAHPQGDATLAGAYYGLFYANKVTDPSGIKRKAGELVCIGVTDENGRIVFDNSDAERPPGTRSLIWGNSDGQTNYGTMDFPIYLPVFERQDRRIYPAKYYIQELVPSRGYLLDIDPDTAELDANGVPIPGTGTARKYEVDAYDYGNAANPVGVRVDVTVTEQAKMRGFLLRKLRSDGNETEHYNLNGAGFSVYLIADLMEIIEKKASTGPSVKIPQRGSNGWDKQDFIDFFYEEDYEHPPDTGTGKDWYNHEGNTYDGRYNFDLYPELKRARIDYVESPVFYSGVPLVPGLRYGKYGDNYEPQNGEVVFPEFPYGEYIVFETYVPTGLDRVKPFIVNIAEDGGDVEDDDGICNPDRPEQDWRIQIDLDNFWVRIWKKDAETGRVVVGKGAGYRLKYLGTDGVEGTADDRWVEMDVPTKNGIERIGTEANPFRVGANGVLILPQRIKAGKYKLYEVEAPGGYVLSYHERVDDAGFHQAEPEQICKHGYGFSPSCILYAPVIGSPDPQPDVRPVFDTNEAHRVADFDADGDGYNDFVIELVQFNERQKGRLNIHKAREAVPEHGGRPTTMPLAGVRFELYAAEDILTLDGHGKVIFSAGELVATTYTDADGNAFFKDLHLGLYLLREADIDDSDKARIGGRLVSGYKFVDELLVDLRPPEGAGLDADSPFWQENAVIAASWDMLNVLQLGRVEIYKYGRTDGESEALSGVVFDVVAAEDIICVNTGETVFDAGAVVGTIVTDDEGRGSLGELLPGEYILREVLAPKGYVPIDDKYFTISERGHTDDLEWHSWDIFNARAVTVEVDKDTIRRTSAAFASLPGQAGHNNIGRKDERYRYDVNFRLTSAIWVDEFVVDDPLEKAVRGEVFVEEIWTPIVWGDHDGLWNLWYGTNKTDPETDYSLASAMDTNPYNPDNPERIAAYPNTGLKLLAQGLGTDQRYHFTLNDFGLGDGEYLTHLRYEYGRVEVGFTSKNYSSTSLNDRSVIDWTPDESTHFYSQGALTPGYELKGAAYLVSAAKPMTDGDIVSSVSAHVARDVVMLARDDDKVITKVFGTFVYSGEAPSGNVPRTLDDYPLLMWLLALLSASIGLLVMGRVSMGRRINNRERGKAYVHI